MEVEDADDRGRTATAERTKTATKPLPAPFQKHSPSGCTIVSLRRTAYRFADFSAVS